MVIDHPFFLFMRSLLDKICQFFVTCDDDLSPIEKLVYERRAKLIVHFGLAYTFVYGIFFTYYRLFAPRGWTDYILLVSFIIIFVVLFSLKKLKNLNFAKGVMFFMLLFMHPLRMYFTGGLESSSTIFCLVGVILVYALCSKRTTIVYIVLVLLQLIAFAFLPVPSYEQTIISVLGSQISAVLATWLIMWSIFDTRKQFENEAKKVKKLETLNLLITTMAHEINNPLFVLTGNISMLKSEYPESEKWEVLENHLIRIQNIVKKISEIKTEEDIVIKPYSESTDMLDLYTDKDFHL